MNRKHQFVVFVEGGGDGDSGIFSDRDTAVECFRQTILRIVRDEIEESENDFITEKVLNGDYCSDDSLEEAVAAFQNYETPDYFGEPAIGWAYTHPIITEGKVWEGTYKQYAYGCDFSLFVGDESGFRRKWLVSLACLPIFESSEEKAAYWDYQNGEAKNDEFIKTQFVGENGKPWNPFSELE